MQEKPLVEEDLKYNPEILVRFFKYYKQHLNKTAIFYLPFDKIPTKSYYSEYKKYFDKTSYVCKKYGIDPERYIKFCIFNLGIRDADEMTRTDNFINYANELKVEEQYRKIYNHYIKSANYVADECIRRNITPKEFLRELIITKKFAYEYMSGNLSMYYIATIKDIDKICEHLDQNSRDELSIILDVHEKLNQDVQDAFIKFKNKKVSPLSLSEQLIKLKTKQG